MVFARAPLAGRVKTRLAPRLGAAGAARLQMRLIRHAVHTAVDAHCGPVELHVTRRHGFFDSFDTEVKLQRGRDLGERMHHALCSALRCHRTAILIGADCPSLTAADLRRAARWLKGGANLVLAPAEDGGYALIGARRISSRVFANVEWGSSSVMAQTIQNLECSRRLWRTSRGQG